MEYENEDMPINHRARWTDEELKTLLKEIKKNLDFNIIANNHKRTIGAIKYKLIRYAIDKGEKDQTLTLENLINMTKLSREDLLGGFEKLHYDYKYLIEDEKKEDDKEEIEEEQENEQLNLLISLNRKIKVYGTFIILLQFINIYIHL